MTKVFDIIKHINEKKPVEDLSDYVPFIVNRAFSYFNDTVLYANELNQYQNIPNKAQYLYLINSLSKKKRFSKWAKSVISEDLMAIQKYYGYSIDKARNALKLLNEEQIDEIKKIIKGVENG